MVVTGRVTRREVAEYFLRLETDKGDTDAARLISLASIGDEEFYRRLRDYADARKTNWSEIVPALIWIVGVAGDDRYRTVREWHRTQIDLGELYSCDIGQQMKDDLDAVQGNLRAFTATVKSNSGKYHYEFNLARLPEDGEQRTIIGVAHPTNGRQGRVELIDGAHRAVSMIANGIVRTPAYIAILYNS